MHDLINDLAQLVAGDICCRLEDNKQHMFSHRSRHSSYITSWYDTVNKFGAFDQANSLRTFLQLNKYQRWHWQHCYLTNVVLVELLPRLGYLRALSLCGYAITELPDFLQNLKHLRYLNLSHTCIKCLPDSLCTLYYLDTLLLKGCSKLQRLPSEMENLVNLHYLDIRGADSIEKTPLGIGNLINLQRLSDFVIGEGDGHRIGELKSLSNVRGDFCLSGLENVNGQDAREARLNEKSGINTLVLQWSGDLEKPTRKKEVVIFEFWWCKIPHLVSRFFLEEQVSKFPSLGKLLIRQCPQLLGRLPTRLQSLQRLEIRECRRLVVAISSFPSLRELSIDGCEELVEECSSSAVEEVSSLQSVSLSSISKFSIPEERRLLRFANAKDFKTGDFNILPKELHAFTFLTRMALENCEGLVCFAESNFPAALKQLRISHCDDLQCLFDERMSSKTCLLEDLEIRRCQSLI